MSTQRRTRARTGDQGSTANYTSWRDKLTGACEDFFPEGVSPNFVFDAPDLSGNNTERVQSQNSVNGPDGGGTFSTVIYKSQYGDASYTGTDGAIPTKGLDIGEKWTHSTYGLGTGDWTASCWFYLPTGSYNTGARPLGIFGNHFDKGWGWGGRAKEDWAFTVVPNFNGTFQVSWEYSDAGGSPNGLTDSSVSGTGFLDTWHWLVACRKDNTTNNNAIWLDGTRLDLDTLSTSNFDDSTNTDMVVGNTGINGWGTTANSAWPGYVNGCFTVKGTALYDPADTTIPAGDWPGITAPPCLS